MKNVIRHFLFILLLVSIKSYGADYYWVGGSGSWSDINHWATTSGGSAKHIQTPTASDNVIFDQNSMTSTAHIDLNIGTIFCANFDATKVNNNLSFSGITSIWKIYGSFEVNNKVSLNTGAKLYLEAQKGNYNLNFANNQIQKIYFKGTASWQLTNKLNCGTIHLESGTFNTNSYTVDGDQFNSSGSLTRELILANSTLEFGIWNVKGNTYSVDAGKSEIFIGKSFAHANGKNLKYHNLTLDYTISVLSSTSMHLTFHRVEFKQNGSISGDHTYDSLIFARGKEYIIGANTTQTFIDGLFAMGSCHKKTTIMSPSSFATFSKKSGKVYGEYLKLKYIHASGGANFEAAATEDLGGNTGWKMSPEPPRTVYWIKGIGEWSDTAHWSYSSGGPGGACVPTIIDNVIIDQNSSSAQGLNIKLNIEAVCHDITWHNQVIGQLSFKKQITISGSMFLGNLVEIKDIGGIVFVSDEQGETVNTSGIDLKGQNILFFGLGSWTLKSSIINNSGRIKFIKGHLYTNGQYISTQFFYIEEDLDKKLNLSSSTIDVLRECRIEQEYLSINPGTSHIRMLSDTAIFTTTGKKPDSLYNLTISTKLGGTSVIANTFFNKVQLFCNMILEKSSKCDSLIFKEGHQYTFDKRTDIINKAFIANGSCKKVITMRDETTMGKFFFIIPAGATIEANHLALRGCNGSGGANFMAKNSSDLGKNQGWTFNNTSQNLYWVNGQGSWQDEFHWSYSSGGSGGACIPKIYNNVFFDNNSFTTNQETVSVDSCNIFCKNMDWTGATGQPSFVVDSTLEHFISGNLKLTPLINFYSKGKTFFVWDQNNKTIEMAGNIFRNDIHFCDTGQWSLMDSLVLLGSINHYTGDLLSAGNHIQAYSYNGGMDEQKKLEIDSITFSLNSPIYPYFIWHQDSASYLISDQSHLVFESGGLLRTLGSGRVIFHNISFLANHTHLGEIEHPFQVTNQFNKLYFHTFGHIHGDNYIDSLIFSPSCRYLIAENSNQYITHYWQADADCHSYIYLDDFSHTSTGSTVNIHMLNGDVNLSGVRIKNINGVGSGNYTITNGIDLGHNSPNWQIIMKPARSLYWVNDGGNWFDSTHWALSSGGKGGECIPTFIDDVHFDNNSFSGSRDSIVGTTTLPLVNLECHDMIWSNTLGLPRIDVTEFNIHGSLQFNNQINTNKLSKINLFAKDTGNTLYTSGHLIPFLNLLGSGGWRLTDNINTETIFHKEGTFISAAKKIKTNTYSSTGGLNRGLNIESSEFLVHYLVNISSDNFILSSKNSHIRFDSGVPNPIFKLELSGLKPLHFNELSFEPVNKGKSTIKNSAASKHLFSKVTINNSADILGEHLFDTLIFQPDNTYQLEEGKTQHINDHWLVRGNNCFAIILQSTKKDYAAYVSKSNGNVYGDFINMRDIHTIGATTFYAGDFSSDISNNSGWIFSNGPQYVYGLEEETSFALGGSIKLSSKNFNGGPNTTYLWSTGSTEPDITINQTGWYHITVTYAGGCILYDSIWVGCDLKMKYNISNNPCNGDSLGSIEPLIPDTAYHYDFLWSNKQLTKDIEDLAAGSYSVIISADSGLCVLYDTLSISEPPPIICPQGDSAFCEGDSIMLNLGAFENFRWNDKYKEQHRWVSQADTFIVQVQDTTGCWSTPDTLDIYADIRPKILLGNDTTLCQGDVLSLDAGSGYDYYFWSNNAVTSTTSITYTGVYWVNVKHNTCSVFDSIEVYNCPAEIKIPNVFTPNGDGVNDFFEIEYQNIWEADVKIFNRWGRLVFQTDDISNFWDGRINGQEASEAVYFWQISYKEYNGRGGGNETKNLSGTITLLRD